MASSSKIQTINKLEERIRETEEQYDALRVTLENDSGYKMDALEDFHHFLSHESWREVASLREMPALLLSVEMKIDELHSFYERKIVRNNFRGFVHRTDELTTFWLVYDEILYKCKISSRLLFQITVAKSMYKDIEDLETERWKREQTIKNDRKDLGAVTIPRRRERKIRPNENTFLMLLMLWIWCYILFSSIGVMP